MNDFFFDGTAHGDVATRLLNNGMNPNCMRLYQGENGLGSYMDVPTGLFDADGNPIFEPRLVSNAPATLRYDEWKLFDDITIREAMPRMRFINDLRSRGLVRVIPNGLGVIMIQHQTMGRITPATISMSPLRRSERDRPQYDVGLLPLPIIHKDGWFDIREVEVSRRGGTPVDTETISLANEEVAIEAEKLAIGISSSYSYGGATVYGLLNHPDRNTQVLVAPTTAGWTPNDLITEILSMIQKMNNDRFYGPFMLYHSPDWAPYLDNDYSATYGGVTLRDRINRIAVLDGVAQLDYLTGWHMVLVDMNGRTIRLVIGMDISTLQWATDGDMRLNFKVMAIIVPQLRGDGVGNIGIVHANV